MDGVRDLHLEDAITYVGSPEAELEALARVHTTKYLDELEAADPTPEPTRRRAARRAERLRASIDR